MNFDNIKLTATLGISLSRGKSCEIEFMLSAENDLTMIKSKLRELREPDDVRMLKKIIRKDGILKRYPYRIK